MTGWFLQLSKKNDPWKILWLIFVELSLIEKCFKDSSYGFG